MISTTHGLRTHCLLSKRFVRSIAPGVHQRMQARGAAAPAGPDHNQHTNRLTLEQSPYLLQHQHNPVDWHPWGAEAIQKAKEEDKIRVSGLGTTISAHVRRKIGGCHVMERESFEDQETADILNKHFISIKVDREERPDVDRVYMSYVQAISGRGGWPMSVFLTPDLEPIYGGTYYPKSDMMRGGQLVMPSFTTVLRRLAAMWRTNKEDLKAKGTSIMSQLQQAIEGGQQAASGQQQAEQQGESAGLTQLQPDMVEHALTLCVSQLAKRFDAKLGGFGGAPKFPRPSEINSLLCGHLWAQQAGTQQTSATSQALQMALFTLNKMAAGGMYDHVGGGFHRYSVDEYWHVPHFEKMLYDNTQLAATYLAAYQLTGDTAHADVARGVLDYLRREMMSEKGGLYSAQDADSYNPEMGLKTEGFSYLWTYKEIEDVLGTDKASLICKAYNIKPKGNCTFSHMSDPHDEFAGRNVPIILTPLSELAQKEGLSIGQLEAELAAARKLLYDMRAARPQPSRDDKVVCCWNGLGISAFALASRALQAEETPVTSHFPVDGLPAEQYLQHAVAIATFVRSELWDEQSGTLSRSYCKTVSNVPGFADDYAYLIAGLLDLYEAGGGLPWLAWAAQLQQRMDELFWDPVQGGYYSTTDADPNIKLRIKDSYDGAEPTASSVAAGNLFRLAALLPASPATTEGGTNMSYLDRAESTVGAFSETLFEAPLTMPQLCCAAYLKLRTPLRQVILSCSPAQEHGLSSFAGQKLLDAIHTSLTPDKAVIIIDLAAQQDVEFWSKHNPEALGVARAHFTAHPGDGATVFVCQNYTCQAPTTDPSQVIQLLKSSGSSAGPSIQPLTAGSLPGL